MRLLERFPASCSDPLIHRGGAPLGGGNRLLRLHKGLMVVMDPRDKNSYEVHFNPATVRINGDLQLDSDVTLNANFDGKTYDTSAILVTPTSNQ